MTFDLSSWFVHELVVSRYLANSAYGKTYAAPETVVGFYSDKTEYSGGQVIAAGRFAFGLEVAYVPVQSQVVLPAQFGGRTVHVVSVEVGDGGGRPVPSHQEIGVL